MNIKEKYILALDQGTSSSRAILWGENGGIEALATEPVRQLYPENGWVEQDPEAIWLSQLATIEKVFSEKDIDARTIAAIGIANQRETTIVWDRETSQPIYNAIVWQDRRTAKYCQELKEKGYEKLVKEKTGLVLDAYFSASKVRWILQHVDGAMEKARSGKLCFGTVDTWLLWKLSNGKRFKTDVSNASRTLLFDIHKKVWDADLLRLFEIPKAMLPEVGSNSEVFGYASLPIFSKPIPIAGIAGDQQAALFGQMCWGEGMLKTTYGTGCFLLLHTGNQPVHSKEGLLTTIAWELDGEVSYALEGSVFVGGAAVEWLRDGVKMIKKASDIEALASKVTSANGVYFVPALTGLGAPYWDQNARGGILGITRATTDAHIARATLNGIAYQVNDVVQLMRKESHKKHLDLRVDGGASVNNLLLQIQSNILMEPIVRPKMVESTAFGVAIFAGLAVGFWKNKAEVAELWELDKSFKPEVSENIVFAGREKWQKAVSRVRDWEE